MVIVNKVHNKVAFGTLSCGDVFKDRSSNICMKVEPNGSANMVYLSDGVLGTAEDNEIFESIKCQLVIE